MADPTREFCERALREPDAFWAEQASAVHWQRPFSQVCDYSRPPFARWFVGGETNLCFNALDRHLAERGEQTAIHFLSSETDEARTLSFRELHRQVNALAADWRGFLPDHRALRQAAAPRFTAGPSSPLRDTYADAAHDCHSAGRRIRQ